MSEDAPVNTGVAEWPDAGSAYYAVRRMQAKLHGWAGVDPSRRFDDLFNLVHRRIQRRRDPLPLPRQQDTDPMDPDTGSHQHRRLTNDQDTWRARCPDYAEPGVTPSSPCRHWWRAMDTVSLSAY
jgi:hypothetical protein